MRAKKKPECVGSRKTLTMPFFARLKAIERNKKSEKGNLVQAAKK